MQELAKRFLDTLYLAERIVTFGGFAVMAVALIVDVGSREFFGTGIFGAPQVGVFGMVVVAMLGLGVASATGSHLRPRFADKVVPASWNDTMDRLAEVIFAGFCLGVAWVATLVVMQTADLGEVSPVLRWEIWPFQAVIVAAFGIAAIRHLLFAIYPELRPEPQGEDSAPKSPEGPPPKVDQHRVEADAR